MQSKNIMKQANLIFNDALLLKKEEKRFLFFPQLTFLKVKFKNHDK